jgi:hypothetical protein
MIAPANLERLHQHMLDAKGVDTILDKCVR